MMDVNDCWVFLYVKFIYEENFVNGGVVLGFIRNWKIVGKLFKNFKIVKKKKLVKIENCI